MEDPVRTEQDILELLKVASAFTRQDAFEMIRKIRAVLTKLEFMAFNTDLRSRMRARGEKATESIDHILLFYGEAKELVDTLETTLRRRRMESLKL